MRVVSLVPSLTETATHLGVQPVACTKFCERPDLMHVGGTKDPDIAAIVALHPDVVLMDREENRREDFEALTGHGVDVLVTHVTAMHDVAPMLAVVAARLGVAPDSPASDAPPAVDGPQRSAFVAIWRRPWMTISAATYGSTLLAWIGVTNVFADATTTYPTVTLAEVAERAPQLVLLPSEPYPFKQRHVAELQRALPGSEIRLVDGRDLFWWGTRTAPARARLAQALAPVSPA